MKNTITHLPDKKQRELVSITETIRNSCDDIAMIILYGSYARGDYKEEKDLPADRKSGHASDYDILVVTGQQSTADDAQRWQMLNELFLRKAFSAPVRVIAEDIEALNIALSQGQYFFSDVSNDGVFLYNSQQYQLSKKGHLTESEKRRISKDYFDHGLASAKEFLENYQFNYEKGYQNKAAFMLNQASETAYKTVLLVFTHYSPNEHYLKYLGDAAQEYEPALKDIFPQDNIAAYKCFKLLDYAYIGARYDNRYRINNHQLEYLAERVSLLIDIVDKSCKKQLS